MAKTPKRATKTIPAAGSGQVLRETLRHLGELIHVNAVDKGFWSGPRNDGEAIALVHSELSEALEALRTGKAVSEHIPAYSGVEEELADAVIRILDLAAGRGWDLAGAILAKMEFNRGRAYRHGKAF